MAKKQAATVARTVPCEVYSSSGHYLRHCGKPATQFIWKGYGNDRHPEPVCNFHAGVERRRQWSQNEVLLLTDAEFATVERRTALREEREAEHRAAKKAESEKMHRAHAKRLWEEYPQEWTATLVLDERWSYTAIEVHLSAVGTTGGWDDMVLTLESDGTDTPTYVRSRGAGNMTPGLTRALADVLPVMAGWAEEASAL